MASLPDVRSRTLTEKGVEYTRDQSEKRFRRSVRAVKKQVSHLDEAAAAGVHQKVKLEIDCLDKVYNNFLSVVAEVEAQGLVDNRSKIHDVNVAVATAKMNALKVSSTVSSPGLYGMVDERMPVLEAGSAVITISGEDVADVMKDLAVVDAQFPIDATACVVSKQADAQSRSSHSKVSHVRSRGSQLSTSSHEVSLVTLYGKLVNQMELLEQVLSGEDKHMVQQEYDILNKTADVLTDAYLNFVLAGGDGASFFDMKKIDLAVFELKKKTCSWQRARDEKHSSRMSSSS